nr:DNA repair protein RecO [Sphingomicrobium sp. B8]
MILATRPHGEHGAIVRMMSEEKGLVAAYVRGARGRRLGPVLLAGNVVKAELTARNDTQLAQGSIELSHSRGPLLTEPLPAAAIAWVSALTASALPEEQPFPRLHAALSALFDAIENAPAASKWGTALVRYELLLLKELGFGLDLDACAVTGEVGNLAVVSPKTGRAVSAAAAEPYKGQLLPLPPFLVEGGSAPLPQILDGLALTGHFLDQHILVDRNARLADARERLLNRLHAAA